jgi:DNA-binding MarR family transcriptional regulator
MEVIRTLEFNILNILKTKTSFKDLKKQLNLSKGYLSKVIKKLERLGLIESFTDLSEGYRTRTKYLKINKNGEYYANIYGRIKKMP